MKKLKLYLDTSVISHLDAPDTPEKMADTLMLWEMIKTGEYSVYISSVVIYELNRCLEPKLTKLINALNSVKPILLEESEEVTTLAKQYIESNILTKKSFADCQHIAYACVYDCDVIVSWNFNHMVNLKTISGIKAVNAFSGYKEIQICTPTILISGDV